MISFQQLGSVLPTLPLVREHGPWARAVALHHLQGPPPKAAAGSPTQPLWPGGAPEDGARYTPKGSFGSIYLASDPFTALAEVRATFVHRNAPPTISKFYPTVVFVVQGTLTGILDLCDDKNWPLLGVDHQELTGEWVYSQELHLAGRGPLPRTQVLGRAAYDCGTIVGLRFPFGPPFWQRHGTRRVYRSACTRRS